MPDFAITGSQLGNDCGCFQAAPAPYCFDEIAIDVGQENRPLVFYFGDDAGNYYRFPSTTDDAGIFHVLSTDIPDGLFSSITEQPPFIQGWFTLPARPRTERLEMANNGVVFQSISFVMLECGESSYDRLTFTAKITNCTMAFSERFLPQTTTYLADNTHTRVTDETLARALDQVVIVDARYYHNVKMPAAPVHGDLVRVKDTGQASVIQKITVQANSGQFIDLTLASHDIKTALDEVEFEWQEASGTFVASWIRK